METPLSKRRMPALMFFWIAVALDQTSACALQSISYRLGEPWVMNLDGFSHGQRDSLRARTWKKKQHLHPTSCILMTGLTGVGEILPPSFYGLIRRLIDGQQRGKPGTHILLGQASFATPLTRLRLLLRNRPSKIAIPKRSHEKRRVR